MIYNEKEIKFKVIVFDLQKAYSSVKKIKFFPPRKIGRKKTFPIYKFFDNRNNYIFEMYYLPLINHLNNLPGEYGWFSENYGGEPNDGSAMQKDGRKRIWQLHNTKKLDAIREEIDKIAKDEIEKSVLLTSLIIAMDKVDSSVGHQVSYLKKWAPELTTQ